MVILIVVTHFFIGSKQSSAVLINHLNTSSLFFYCTGFIFIKSIQFYFGRTIQSIFRKLLIERLLISFKLFNATFWMKLFFTFTFYHTTNHFSYNVFLSHYLTAYVMYLVSFSLSSVTLYSLIVHLLLFVFFSLNIYS